MVNRLSSAARDEAHFTVLRLLAERPHASQREIAAELGISVGRTNYLVRGLVEKGHVRLENFRASPHKLGYWHVLTPTGLAARAALAGRFLARKLAEYEALEAEIAALRQEARPGSSAAPPHAAAPAHRPD